MNITLPTIHLNGTGAKTIFEENVEASTSCSEALAIIEKMEFNARDYYPQGPEAYTAARAERNVHVEALRKAKEHFMAIALHAQEFIKG